MTASEDKSPLRAWQWWVSGLLLLATMLNYMDRQALANLSVRITDELALSQERYGDLELAFGWAFAAGSLCFGILADRLPVRWLYPAVVIGWSTVGVLTGFSRGYGSMLVAPVTVGAEATVGAVSTITKSVPRKSLTLERSQQRTLQGWRRPQKLDSSNRAEVIKKSGLKDEDATSD